MLHRLDVACKHCANNVALYCDWYVEIVLLRVWLQTELQFSLEGYKIYLKKIWGFPLKVSFLWSCGNQLSHHRKRSVKLRAMGSKTVGKTTNHKQEQAIRRTIMYSLKNTPVAECYRALVYVTPGFQQLTRSWSRIKTAVLPEQQGYEPPKKRGTINGLKKTWKHKKRQWRRQCSSGWTITARSPKSSELSPGWNHIIS